MRMLIATALFLLLVLEGYTAVEVAEDTYNNGDGSYGDGTQKPPFDPIYKPPIKSDYQDPNKFPTLIQFPNPNDYGEKILTDPPYVPPTERPPQPPTQGLYVPPKEEPPKQDLYEPPTERPPQPPTQGPYVPPKEEPPKQDLYEPPTERPPQPPTQGPYVPPKEEPPKQDLYEPPTERPPQPPTQGQYVPPKEEPPKPDLYEPPTERPPQPPTLPPYVPTTERPKLPPVEERHPQPYANCLSRSSDACYNRKDGDYPLCYPLCCDGNFIKCSNGFRFIQDCPLAFYGPPSSFITAKMVFNPFWRRCERSTLFCPRWLDNQIYSKK